MSYHFAENTPIVVDNTVILNLTFGRGVLNATCALFSRNRKRVESNCKSQSYHSNNPYGIILLSGFSGVTFTGLPMMISQFTPEVTVKGRLGMMSMMDMKRSFFLGTYACS